MAPRTHSSPSLKSWWTYPKTIYVCKGQLPWLLKIPVDLFRCTTYPKTDYVCKGQFPLLLKILVDNGDITGVYLVDFPHDGFVMLEIFVDEGVYISRNSKVECYLGVAEIRTEAGVVGGLALACFDAVGALIKI